MFLVDVFDEVDDDGEFLFGSCSHVATFGLSSNAVVAIEVFLNFFSFFGGFEEDAEGFAEVSNAVFEVDDGDGHFVCLKFSDRLS